jgi:hypothetical protein
MARGGRRATPVRGYRGVTARGDESLYRAETFYTAETFFRSFLRDGVVD